MEITRTSVSEFHTGNTTDLARHRASGTSILKGITIKAVETVTITSQSGPLELAAGETITLEVDRFPVVTGNCRFIAQ